MLLITATDVTVWILSALLALGIGWGKYSKWKARNELVRQLAAMDRERREKVLNGMEHIARMTDACEAIARGAAATDPRDDEVPNDRAD